MQRSIVSQAQSRQQRENLNNMGTCPQAPRNCFPPSLPPSPSLCVSSRLLCHFCLSAHAVKLDVRPMSLHRGYPYLCVFTASRIPNVGAVYGGAARRRRSGKGWPTGVRSAVERPPWHF